MHTLMPSHIDLNTVTTGTCLRAHYNLSEAFWNFLYILNRWINTMNIWMSRLLAIQAVRSKEMGKGWGEIWIQSKQSGGRRSWRCYAMKQLRYCDVITRHEKCPILPPPAVLLETCRFSGHPVSYFVIENSLSPYFFFFLSYLWVLLLRYHIRHTYVMHKAI